ncbi:hypothetical protein Hte_002349 [Hypoxylon texense]
MAKSILLQEDLDSWLNVVPIIQRHWGSIGVTTSSVLASLVHQLLKVCPNLWTKMCELYDPQDVIDALDGQSAHLRELLLWRLLKALISGNHHTPIVCVLSVLDYSGSSGAELDLAPSTILGEGTRMDSSGNAMFLCAMKLVLMLKHVDSNFKVLVVLPTGVVVPADTPLTATRLDVERRDFKDSVREDIVTILRTVTEARSLIGYSQDKLMESLRYSPFEPLRVLVLLKNVEERNFVSIRQLEGHLGLLSLQDVLKATLSMIPETDRPYVRDILLFTCFATRPLRAVELPFIYLMSVENVPANTWHATPVNTRNGLPAYFSSLVYFNGPQLYPIHPILKEILCDKPDRDGSPEPWYFLGQHPHLEMARRCLRLLQLSSHLQFTKPQGGDQPDSTAKGISDIVEIKYKIPREINPAFILPDGFQLLLDYAAINWTAHHMQGTNDGAPDIECTEIMKIFDQSIFQEWQRRWYLARSPYSSTRAEQPIQPTLRQLPATLAKKTQLNSGHVISAVSEALHVLQSVDGHESIALTWGIAQASGETSVAATFWMNEVPEDCRDLNLLLRNFGRNPSLTFQLLTRIDENFVQGNIQSLLIRDLEVGGSSVLKYMNERPELSAKVNLTVEYTKDRPCASLGISEIIEHSLPDLMPYLAFTQNPDRSARQEEKSNGPFPGDKYTTSSAAHGDLKKCISMQVAVAAGNLNAVKALSSRDMPGDAIDDDEMAAIVLASKHGFSTILEYLLQLPVDLNFQPRDGEAPLKHASLCGYYRIASLLLDRGVSPVNLAYRQSSPLLIAVMSNHVQLVKLFVEKSFRLDTEALSGVWEIGRSNNEELPKDTNNWGSSARGLLGFAATESIVRGFPELAKYLIEQGAETCQVDDGKNSLLHLATQNGMADVVDSILTRCPTIIDNKNDDGETALIQAAKRGDRLCVSVLLRGGADSTIRDVYDSSPIEIATSRGFVDIVQTILQFNTDAKLLGESLQVGAMKGWAEIVTILLDAGAEKDYVDGSGNTALQLAAYFDKGRVVEVLLRRQVNLELRDSSGRTALADAVRKGHDQIVQLLLAAGADIGVEDEDGKTPLGLAIEGGHQDMVLSLLSSGTKAIRKDATLLLNMVEKGMDRVVEHLLHTGSTMHNDKSNLDLTRSMQMAIELNNADTVSLLLDYGTDSDTLTMLHPWDPERRFGYPIHLAAFLCKEDAAKALLTHKTRKLDVNITGGIYWTALYSSLASKCDFYEKRAMFELLIKHGADPTIQGPDGPLLHFAARRVAPALMDVVQSACRERGLAIETPDSEGRLVSHFASMNPLANILRKLALPIAMLDEKDSQGRRPIHFAAGAGSTAALSYLIQRLDPDDIGEYLGQVDNDGWNSLHWGCRQNDKDTVALILALGGPKLKEKETNDHQRAEDISARHDNFHFVPLLTLRRPSPSPDQIEVWPRAGGFCKSCVCVR